MEHELITIIDQMIINELILVFLEYLYTLYINNFGKN